MNIKDLRVKNGFTQKQLSELMEVDIRTVQRWEEEMDSISSRIFNKVVKRLKRNDVKTSDNTTLPINLDKDSQPYSRDEVDNIMIGVSELNLKEQNDVLIMEVSRLRALILKVAEAGRS